jgi:hypothetical protein
VGEPAWSELGRAQVAGSACVICAPRLWPQQGVVVGRYCVGSPVFVCAGVCAARAACLGDTRPSSGRVMGGGGGGGR